jgi:hypothetical protein
MTPNSHHRAIATCKRPFTSETAMCATPDEHGIWATPSLRVVRRRASGFGLGRRRRGRSGHG